MGLTREELRALSPEKLVQILLHVSEKYEASQVQLAAINARLAALEASLRPHTAASIAEEQHPTALSAAF